MQFQVLKSRKTGQWFWRLKADNGETVADSAESYINRLDAIGAIRLIQTKAFEASIDIDEEWAD
jgi:uncharacterized protein YegP (UPF0339 family)